MLHQLDTRQTVFRESLYCIQVILMCCVASVACGQVPEYSVEFLRQPFAGLVGAPGEINDNGLVAGTWGNAIGQQVIRWDSTGSFEQLSIDPRFPTSAAGGINNEGAVVGTIVSSEVEFGVRLSSATLWTADRDQVRLEPLPDARFDVAAATGINDLGQVVGTSYSEDGTHAVVWDSNGLVMDVGVPENYRISSGVDINDDGTVLGMAMPTTYPKPFLWDPANGFEVILHEEPILIVPLDMNNQQQIVGHTNDRNAAFLWDRASGLREIPDFPGGIEEVWASSVSEEALVIGEGHISNTSVPFIWQESMSEIVTLESRVVDMPDNWFLVDVGEFNSKGQINARAFYDDGFDQESTLVVLTPVPSGLVGDFNADKIVDAFDMDLLSRHVREGGNDAAFDLNGDQQVNGEDRLFWLSDGVGRLLGDADLDGVVGFRDFLALSRDFGKPGGWAEGDFDGSGEIQFPDFLSLSLNFGERVVGAAAVVPEPRADFMLWLVGCCIAIRLRRMKPNRLMST